MPYTLSWESPDTMRCRFYGDIDFADLNHATNDFYNDQRSDRVRNALWDFSAMTHFRVNDDQVLEIAATDNMASRYMKPMRAAFITTDAEFAELARHYTDEMERSASAWTNRLFFSLEDAREWIASP